MSEEIEKRLNELENPTPDKDFHHYVQPLAERLGELEKLEKVVEEIYKRTGMSFVIDKNGEVREVIEE